jgi:TRAP-type C4-dicarboxylate transport system permease small subunit
MLNSIDRTLHFVEKVLLVGSIVATLFLTFLIVIDVFLRYVFNSPLPATWEMSELGMPYIVFLAFAFTLSVDGHVRVTLFTIRLPSQAQRACKIFTNIVCLLTCAVFAYTSWLRFWESFLMREEILAAIKLPWYVGKFAMPIGMAMFSFRYLLRLINNLGYR